MTTDQLTGRALDEAAALAMGWTYDGTDWFNAARVWRPCEDDVPEPTEREMLAWLHEHAGFVDISTGRLLCIVKVRHRRMGSIQGTDLREALARLVVAVAARAAREAKA